MAKFQRTPGQEMRREDGAAIAPGGKGWDEYEEWLAQGNVPDELPAPAAARPTLEQRVAELERLVGQLVEVR